MKLARYKGHIFLILSQTMIGASIVGTKELVTAGPANLILMFRFLVAFVVLMAFQSTLGRNRYASLKELNRTDWIYMVIQALCAGALFNFFIYLGLQYTSASLAGIITCALPAIVAIFSIIFLKEKLTPAMLMCILLALTGLVIVNLHNFHSAESMQLMGSILIVLALFPEAAYYILSKLHHNKLPTFLVAALLNCINLIVFIISVIFYHPVGTVEFFSHHVWLVLSVGTSSALFYTFWYLGSREVHGATVGLLTAFTPIATLLIAYIFLGEKITLVQTMGMLLVMLSIVFNVLRRSE